MLRKRVASKDLLLGWVRLPTGCTVVFAGLLAAGSVGISAPVNPMPSEARLDFMSTDDGLTRESIAAISRPETAHPAGPAKGAAKPTASTPTAEPESTPTATRRRHRLLVSTTGRHHRRWRHRHIARHTQEATPPPASPQTRLRRTFVVKFVTWWNGMVVRNFHTRFGTVKLDSWGADT